MDERSAVACEVLRTLARTWKPLRVLPTGLLLSTGTGLMILACLLSPLRRKTRPEISPPRYLHGLFRRAPQGFLTAVLQNHARKHALPVNVLGFKYDFPDILQPEVTNVGGWRYSGSLGTCCLKGWYISKQMRSFLFSTDWRDVGVERVSYCFVRISHRSPRLLLHLYLNFSRMRRVTPPTVFWCTVCTSRVPRGITPPSDCATHGRTRCERQHQ